MGEPDQVEQFDGAPSCLAGRARCLLLGASLHCILLRVVQFASHASSQRRSACSRSTMPSSRSAASEPSGSSISARLPRVAKPPEQFAALSVNDPDRVGQPGRGRGDELEVELGEVGFRPGDLGEPLADAFLAGGGQRIDLALAVTRSDAPGEGDEAGLLEATKGDVDLAGVQCLAEGAEQRRSAEPAAGSPGRAPWPASPGPPPAASRLRYNGYFKL